MKSMYAVSGLALVSAAGTAVSGHMALAAFAIFVGLAACAVAVHTTQLGRDENADRQFLVWDQQSIERLRSMLAMPEAFFERSEPTKLPVE